MEILLAGSMIPSLPPIDAYTIAVIIGFIAAVITIWDKFFKPKVPPQPPAEPEPVPPSEEPLLRSSMPSQEDLKAALSRLIEGTSNPEDVSSIQQALTSGRITIASGGGVAIGGDARGNVIIAGGATFTLTPEALELLRPSVPHQIPSPPRDFTGRKEELDELLAGFKGGATITGLRGMGGIGKTALAYALAEKLIDLYPDGQILVQLRGTSSEPMTPADAMAKVIQAYRPEARLPESKDDLASIYHSMLHGKHALLLLDNAADDKQVRPLLPPSTCGVIVTSRHKFTLPDLAAKDLNVLKTDKAAELLLKVWKPDASPSSGQLQDEGLKELARLCGFLPLALRAAGSMLASSPDMSLAEYIRDLQDERKRLEKIGKEGVDLDVGSSFALSYGRLRPETSAVFGILSIFPGDFDSHAEEVVCQDEGHRHLSELVRWSMVEFQRRSTEAQGRYHLHDLVRLFAASRIEAAARAEAEQRHAEHYRNVLSIADELYKQGGDGVLAGLELFDLEKANIMTGQAWAVKEMESSSSAAALCSAYPAAGAYVLSLRLHPRQRISWLEKGVEAASTSGLK